MLQLFLSVLVFTGMSVLLMGFKLFFISGGKFPENRIGHNKKLRQAGIYCPKTQDKIDQKGCAGCSFLEDIKKAGASSDCK